MKPKANIPQSGELFKPRLEEMIDTSQPLAKLSGLIDWSVFEREWPEQYPSGQGRPASPGRLVAGLL